jgi:hypothetical protein
VLNHLSCLVRGRFEHGDVVKGTGARGRDRSTGIHSHRHDGLVYGKRCGQVIVGLIAVAKESIAPVESNGGPLQPDVCNLRIRQSHRDRISQRNNGVGLRGGQIQFQEVQTFGSAQTCVFGIVRQFRSEVASPGNPQMNRLIGVRISGQGKRTLGCRPQEGVGVFSLKEQSIAGYQIGGQLREE